MINPGEAKEKFVGLLRITGRGFEIEKLKLKTVRPFVMKEVVLKEVPLLDPLDNTAVSAFLQRKVTCFNSVLGYGYVFLFFEFRITEAEDSWRISNSDLVDFPKPLIRLKVEYSGGFTTFSPQRFGQHFVEIVANPKEILHFYRQKVPVKSLLN
jgi:double-strand break repair protein MRE11